LHDFLSISTIVLNVRNSGHPVLPQIESVALLEKATLRPAFADSEYNTVSAARSKHLNPIDF